MKHLIEWAETHAYIIDKDDRPKEITNRPKPWRVCFKYPGGVFVIYGNTIREALENAVSKWGSL